MNDSLETLKYPIGRFKVPRGITSAFIEAAIKEIENKKIKARIAYMKKIVDGK